MIYLNYYTHLFVTYNIVRKYRWELPKDSAHSERVITATTMDVVHPVDLEINFKRRY